MGSKVWNGVKGVGKGIVNGVKGIFGGNQQPREDPAEVARRMEEENRRRQEEAVRRQQEEARQRQEQTSAAFRNVFGTV